MKGLHWKFADSMVGTRLGQYVIEEQLGAGGMGVVYRAFDTRLERRVAIKTIRDVNADQRSHARLIREARSASALNHPNVCTIYEVAETGEMAYLVMELLEGQPLTSLMPAGGLPMQTVANYGAQIASALAHAHARGLVHSDLKSANVIITGDRAKVLDFGLAARVVDGPQRDSTHTRLSSLTAPGAVVGTFAHMAPETLRGDRGDARTDIWALGVLLYEMATGRLPFEGRTTFELSSRILQDPPLGLPEQVPQALRAIIHKCLAKASAQRYQNAGEVVAALESLAAGHVQPTSSSTSLSVDPSLRTRTILVLPFVNVAADAESDHVSDGLTDEIISDLSGIHRVRVISRSSSMHLKGTRRSVDDLAREFKVQHVLEGTVRRSGKELRITATLVDPDTRSALWGDKYNGTLDDVFQIQETISRSIVDALRVRLTAAEEERLVDRPFADVRAYEWYLRARQELLTFTEEGLRRALECLNQASAIAGDNVLLLAAKGEAYWQYVNAGITPEPAYLDKAEACARQILQLDPASPHGHRVAGLVLVHRGDVAGALRELNRALELDPNDTDSLMWGSLLAGLTGKIPLAEAWAERLVELDPVTPFYQMLPGTAAWMRGDFEAARLEYEAHESALFENPIFRLVYGQILMATDRPAEAHAMLDDLRRALPDNSFARLAVVYRHAFNKERDAMATALTPDLVSALEGDPQYCWFLAQCHALVGDVDAGIRWTEAAVTRGFINYPMLARLDPFLASLRDDPRYEALMEDVEHRWQSLDL
jgi:non-specific serine/threonine protein kinase